MVTERRGPWAGVDVGGRRKGYDVAIVDEARVIDVIPRVASPEAVRRALAEHQPGVVAIDSPSTVASPGMTHRPEERHLRAAVCGIRWMPDQRTLDEGSPYYEWIRVGFELYEALARHGGWEVIECFPTASFTRWVGAREGTRAAWTRRALPRLGLDNLRERTNQDVRDAIAAAVTARQYAIGATDAFGPIVVPKPGLPR